VAKPMHVGHIRSTIIGDCLARVSRFVGHNVITDNHIGDWGTQFGMIVYGWNNLLDEEALEADPIAELLRLYKAINNRIKLEELRARDELSQSEQESFDALELDFVPSTENEQLEKILSEIPLIDLCRSELVALQAGDKANHDIWKRCMELSLDGLSGIYEKLDVQFDHFLGESFYNDALAPLVDRLTNSGVAVESEGAICIFSSGELPEKADPFKIQRDGEWMDVPAMIRKSDGGFLYATTDLATIDHRVKEWGADEMWYVVGAPQQLHFLQVFDAAKRSGHTEAKFVHVTFGSILGQDGKPFKTRSGQNVGLLEVMTESVERARAFIDAREEEDDRFKLPEEDKPKVAEVIGLGSLKYAELSQARMTDYKFDWNKMLSLKGATAPYLINAYVRTRGIFRKHEGDFELPAAAEFTEDPEKRLALKLVQFGEVVPSVLDDHKPNVLASYLYELAGMYHSFFQACPVLKSEGATRETRLLLCEATSRVLKQGLNLMGIETTERM
ncbi:MAG: arginine--tRNA ligase, partial [Verrucomicrobiota bacterium]